MISPCKGTAMSSSSSINEIINVNGGDLNVLSLHELEAVEHEQNYHGFPVYSPLTQQIVLEMIEFVLNHTDVFCLGLQKDWANNWIPHIILKLNSSWQRVQIEHSRCAKCGWLGTIADPTIADLYLGLTSKFEAIRAAYTLPKLNCPRCGEELDRHAVWVDNA